MNISTFSESRKQWPLHDLLLEKKDALWAEQGVGQLVVCGDGVKVHEGALTGHGIIQVTDEHETEEEGEISLTTQSVASLTGIVRQVNQLHYIEGLHSKYLPEPGDVVVGRIVEVGQGRWLIDVGASSLATLHLSAISLPSGEQRRKTDAEQIDMRRFFVEDDLVSTEVQKVNMDGSIMLHTRSARYGKLANGCCVCIPPTLTVRLAQHMVVLKNGVHIVIGKNGFLFVGSAPIYGAEDTLNFVAQSGPRYSPVTIELRQKIALVRNAVVWLADNFVQVCPASIEAVCAAWKKNGGSFDNLWRKIFDPSSASTSAHR